MIKKIIRVQSVLIAMGFSLVANASRYDDCILEGIKGNASEAATIAITRACLHSSQQSLTADALSHIAGTAEYVTGSSIGEPGSNFLRLRIRNATDYQITSITVELKNRKSGSTHDYAKSEFHLTIGEFSDPTRFLSISPGEVRDCLVPIGESELLEGTFNKEYSWSVVAAKGVAQ